MARQLRFETVIEGRPRGGRAVVLPDDPGALWGERARHHVHGTVGGQPARGSLTEADGGWELRLGPAWCPVPSVAAGRRVDVVLEPEGPQLEDLPDLAAALAEDPDARDAFVALASFYRKGFARHVTGARRPETRARRVDEVVAALRDGRPTVR